MSKILLTPIFDVNAKKHFKYEMLATQDQLPNRWSGPKNYKIDDNCKYFAPILPMAKDAKSRILLVYPIISYTDSDVHQRAEWGDEYKACQTVFYGDLAAIIPWDEFIETNQRGPRTIIGTVTHPIEGDWLETRIAAHEQDLDALIALADIPITLEEAKSSFNHSDRYELILKAMIDIEFPNVFKHNETIQTGDVRFRPDFYTTTNKFALVLEYDEQNHLDRNPTKEIDRLNALRAYMQDEYKQPIVVIRYGNKFQRWSDAMLFLEQVRYYLKIGNTKAPIPRGTKKIETVYPNRIVLIGYPESHPYIHLTDWDVVRL